MSDQHDEDDEDDEDTDEEDEEEEEEEEEDDNEPTPADIFIHIRPDGSLAIPPAHTLDVENCQTGIGNTPVFPLLGLRLCVFFAWVRVHVLIRTTFYCRLVVSPRPFVGVVLAHFGKV